MKRLLGCLKVERLSRSVVNSVLGVENICLRDRCEVCSFGKILAKQSVGMLIKAALPGFIGVSEIDFRAGGFGDAGMGGEFFSVVGGEGERGQRTTGDGFSDGVCNVARGFVGHENEQGELGHAVDDADDGSFLLLADDGIYFEVA